MDGKGPSNLTSTTLPRTATMEPRFRRSASASIALYRLFTKAAAIHRRAFSTCAASKHRIVAVVNGRQKELICFSHCLSPTIASRSTSEKCLRSNLMSSQSAAGFPAVKIRHLERHTDLAVLLHHLLELGKEARQSSRADFSGTCTSNNLPLSFSPSVILITVWLVVTFLKVPPAKVVADCGRAAMPDPSWLHRRKSPVT